MVRILTMAFMLLASAAGHDLLAQHPIVRLSRDMPMPELPESIRIQAAAAIAARTLVVWGSTTRTPTDSIRPLLYGQIVNGRHPLGVPVVISLDDADPTTYVQVIPLRDRFLVVWNEMAGRVLRVRARIVGIDGDPGADFLLSDSGRIASSPVPLRRGNGTRLLWNDTLAQPLVHMLDLDATGRPTGPAVIIGSYRVGGVVGRLEEERLSIFDRADQPPLMVDDTGGFHELSPRQLEKLSVPYDIGLDGMVVTLIDSTARFYASLLDTIPFRVLVVRVPAGVFRKILIPSLDSLGRLQVSYPVTMVSEESMGGKAFGIIQRRITYLSDSTFGDVVGIGSTWPRSFGHCDNGVGGEITDVKWVRSCRGQYLLVCSYWLGWTYSCQGRNDRYSISGSASIIYDWPYARECGTSKTAFPLRVDGDRSLVWLVVGADTARLAAPVAMTLRNVVESTPGVNVIDDTLLVGFISNGAVRTASLVRWERRTDRIDSISSLTAGWFASADASRSGVAGAITMVRAADRFLLCQSRAWYDRSPSGDTIPRGSLAFFAPSTKGWGVPVAEAPLGRYRLSLPLRANSDPDAGTCLITARKDENDRDRDVVSLDRNNRIRWSVERGITGFEPGAYLMPGDSDMFRFYDSRYHWRFVRGLRDSALDRTVAPLYSRYERLRGGTTLGVAGGLTNGMIYGRDGERLLPVEVSSLFAVYSDDPFIIQSPRDSSITLVYAAAGGIRMIRTDRWLKIVEPDRIVIPLPGTPSTPMAAFLGDSLVIVWVEEGSGTTDIRGTIIPLAPLPAPPPPSSDVANVAATATPTSLYPNPADGHLLLRRTGAAHAEEILIADITGRVVLRHSCAAGEELVSLDTSELAPGAYLVQVGNGAGSMLNVMR